VGRAVRGCCAARQGGPGRMQHLFEGKEVSYLLSERLVFGSVKFDGQGFGDC
jgi:hypothetical protein